MGSSLTGSLMMGGLQPVLSDFNDVTTTEFQAQVFNGSGKTQLGLTIVPDGNSPNANILGFHNSVTAGLYTCGITTQGFGTVPAPHFLLSVIGGSSSALIAILLTTGTQYPVLLGAGTVASSSGVGTVQIGGNTQKLWDAKRTPANSAAAGVLGEICFDDNFVYVYTAAGWKRTALAAF